jgi:hypothetical protein
MEVHPEEEGSSARGLRFFGPRDYAIMTISRRCDPQNDTKKGYRMQEDCGQLRAPASARSYSVGTRYIVSELRNYQIEDGHNVLCPYGI